MPYPAAAIANEFLRLAWDEGTTLTPMKVQKLVYFAHGWYWALANQPLIDERIQAWKYGPVVPSLYRAFKQYGSAPIAKHISSPYENRMSRIDDSYDSLGNDRAKQVVKRVWDRYGHLTGAQLSNLTHAEDGPWFKTPNKELMDTSISESAIRNYFVHLAG